LRHGRNRLAPPHRAGSPGGPARHRRHAAHGAGNPAHAPLRATDPHRAAVVDRVMMQAAAQPGGEAMTEADFMRRAIALSCDSLAEGGGPFGVVIGEGRNAAVPSRDPTAIGFDDAAIYEEVCLPIPARQPPLRRPLAAEAMEGFRRWQAEAAKVPY
jgi:hypothetical protein